MTKLSSPKPDRIIRFPEAESLAGGVHRVTLIRWIKNGDFPAPFKISDTGTAVGWRLSTLMRWLESRNSGVERGR